MSLAILSDDVNHTFGRGDQFQVKRLINNRKGDEDKIIKMCLIHDLAEVRGGEKNLINKWSKTS